MLDASSKIEHDKQNQSADIVQAHILNLFLEVGNLGWHQRHGGHGEYKDHQAPLLLNNHLTKLPTPWMKSMKFTEFGKCICIHINWINK